MTTEETINKVHKLYCQAYEVCRRADRQGKRYIALQATKKGGFRLAAVSMSHSGKSSFRFINMQLPDWASNVVYRLVEECLVSDLSSDDIDAYFSKLHAVGYDVEV